MTHSTSAEVRRRLPHPVIDADGHMREFLPAAMPYLRDALGSTLFETWRSRGTALQQATKLGSSMQERRRTRKPQSAFWATLSGDGTDRATASSPALLYDRLEELGMDFVVLYPTEAMGVAGMAEDDLRVGLCRGFNDFFAAISEPYRDRLAVAGVVPMHTPDEAIAELDHCHELGLRVACIPHAVVRPIADPATAPESPYLWPGQSHWMDTFGLDSEYDYDPVWEAFSRYGYAVTSHGGMAIPVGVYSSTTSFTYNHLGLLRPDDVPAVQVPFPRWSHPPVPRPAVRVPRMRCQLGLFPARRPGRALGEAQRRRPAGAPDRISSTPPRWSASSVPTRAACSTGWRAI